MVKRRDDVHKFSIALNLAVLERAYYSSVEVEPPEGILKRGIFKIKRKIKRLLTGRRDAEPIPPEINEKHIKLIKCANKFLSECFTCDDEV